MFSGQETVGHIGNPDFAISGYPLAPEHSWYHFFRGACGDVAKMAVFLLFLRVRGSAHASDLIDRVDPDAQSSLSGHLLGAPPAPIWAANHPEEIAELIYIEGLVVPFAPWRRDRPDIGSEGERNARPFDHRSG